MSKKYSASRYVVTMCTRMTNINTKINFYIFQYVRYKYNFLSYDSKTYPRKIKHLDQQYLVHTNNQYGFL